MTDLETTQQLTRGEAADYLRQFAEQLDDRPTDPLTAGHYETDGEPTDTSAAPTATDTSTRGRHEEPASDATTRDATDGAPSARGDADGRSHTEGPHSAGAETDGGTEAAPATDDVSDGPGSPHDDRVTIYVGNDSETVNPPNEVELAVAVGTDDSLVTSGTEQFVTFELTWDADAVDDEEHLDIE